MVARLADQIIVAEEAIILARCKAMTAESPEIQREYKQLERQWQLLVTSLSFAKEVSGFLEWRSQRLEPPPP